MGRVEKSDRREFSHIPPSETCISRLFTNVQQYSQYYLFLQLPQFGCFSFILYGNLVLPFKSIGSDK